ncbi:MAG TPA: hypothetical protein VGQ35_06570 [Dongiaceae bacterium]|nr:hypothetical protein [Dongiaceae bacterium]
MLKERSNGTAAARTGSSPMQIPTWTKPGITGAIVGAIATMIIGFSQGGWYSGGSAERLAQQRADVAVIDALVPICISQSKLDPDTTAKLGQLTALKSSYEQRDFVISSGWATMPAADGPNRDLASKCADALMKSAAS